MSAIPLAVSSVALELSSNVLWPVLLLAFGLIPGIFWLWMLIDCLTKEPTEDNQRLMWALIIVLAPFIGAVLYLFMRKLGRTSNQE